MSKNKNSKKKATVSFTAKLLKHLDRVTEQHFKPRLGLDRSDVICYFCEMGLKGELPKTLADLGAFDVDLAATEELAPEE